MSIYKPMKQFQIRIDEKLLKAVKAAADKDQRTVASWLRMILNNAVK